MTKIIEIQNKEIKSLRLVFPIDIMQLTCKSEVTKSWDFFFFEYVIFWNGYTINFMVDYNFSPWSSGRISI